MIWVVGGTSGIGAAIADKLDLMTDNVDAGGETEEQVWRTGEEIDVRLWDHVKRFSDKHQPRWLVYSAGVNFLDWSLQLGNPAGAAEAMNLYDINVLGLLRCLSANPQLERVLVIGSDAAWRPMRTSAAYCASKSALHMAVKCIAKERADEEFRINVLAPGMTDHTGMQHYVDTVVPELRGWTPEQARQYEDSQAQIGRRATPQEIAEVATHVLTIDTPFMNGSIIPVNGAR